MVRVVIGICNLLPRYLASADGESANILKIIFVVFFVYAAELGRVGRMILNFYKIRGFKIEP